MAPRGCLKMYLLFCIEFVMEKGLTFVKLLALERSVFLISPESHTPCVSVIIVDDESIMSG